MRVVTVVRDVDEPTVDPGRRAATTVVAGVLAIVVAVPFLVGSVGAILRTVSGEADVGSAVHRSLVAMQLPGQPGAVLLVAGSIVLAAAVWAVALGVAILARRGWARPAALFTFGAFTAIALPLGVAGTLSQPAPRNAGLALATGLVQVVLLGALYAQSTADDIEAATWRRSRRRTHTGAR